MNVQEVSEFTAVVPVIDDGDTCGNAEHGATAQALANRTKYLRERTDPVYDLMTGALSSVPVTLSSLTSDIASVAFPNESSPFSPLNPVGVMGRGLGRWIAWLRQFVWAATPTQPLTKFFPVVATGLLIPSKWAPSEMDQNKFYYSQVTTDSPSLWWPLLELPPTGYIKSVTAWVGAAPTQTHSSLPATKPILSFFRQIGPAVVSIGSQTDGSLTTGAYDALHAITVTCNEPIAPGQVYQCRLAGESGAGSLANVFAVYFAAVQLGFLA